MNIASEIAKLADLRKQGVLSDEEFKQAKEKVLSASQPNPNKHERKSVPQYRVEDTSDESLGKAANRYVSFQIFMAIIGFIVFLFFAPMMCSKISRFDSQPNFNFSPMP